MSQTLTNILKSSFCIFLATDDEKLIVDDDDNLYIIIKGFDSLSEVDKHSGVMTSIPKNPLFDSLIGFDKKAGVLTSIGKNLSYIPFFRLLEGTIKSFRLQEGSDGKRLIEDKITNSNIKKS